MADGAVDILKDKRAAARKAAYEGPVEDLNPARASLFRDDAMWPMFERLRKEDPVHYTADSNYGAYWSITKYNDILAVDSNHQVFSSAKGITLTPKAAQGFRDPNNTATNFIAMDPPRHDVQRKTVSPVVSPHNLAILEPLIRERAAKILDSLPIGEAFDWVDKVSMELTAMTLATLFGMPQEDRRKLTRWSDTVMSRPGDGVIDSWEEKRAEMAAYAGYFLNLWNQRKADPFEGDMVSMLAHGEATKDMNQFEYLGNIILLTIGGNDTTRNTISGTIYALNKFPDQYAKLRANPELIPSMVSETIRWQTPLAHMRRRCLQDFDFQGKTIKKGDKVVMWYVSGNRDDEVIDRPNDYIIDRERPRMHMSFGYGIHRCVGNRLAELQLKIIWEEILKRFPTIQVTGEPRRVYSSFVKGYETLPVVIPSRN